MQEPASLDIDSLERIVPMNLRRSALPDARPYICTSRGTLSPPGIFAAARFST